VAEADDAVLAAFHGEPQVAASGDGEGPERQRLVVEVRRDLAGGEAVLLGDSLLEADAFGDVAVDRDADEAEAVGAGDEAVRLDAGDAESLGDFSLRQARGVVKPRGADAQIRLFISRMPGHRDIHDRASVIFFFP
jgi:hypothetical protein